MRHTQVARAGYCLVGRSGCTGLSTQFFRTASTGGADWDFSRYRASAAVINLGTNDIGHGVSGAAFQSAYTAFLRDVRAKYQNAVPFAVQTLKKRYVPETRAAVTARVNAGDGRVRYVDTTGWLSDGADYEDGKGHPNEAGHTKFANRLAPVIGSALSGTAVPSAKAAAPGQPGDPNIKFVGRGDTTGSATAYTPYWAGATSPRLRCRRAGTPSRSTTRSSRARTGATPCSRAWCSTAARRPSRRPRRGSSSSSSATRSRSRRPPRRTPAPPTGG
jgi:hypothetical protein